MLFSANRKARAETPAKDSQPDSTHIGWGYEFNENTCTEFWHSCCVHRQKSNFVKLKNCTSVYCQLHEWQISANIDSSSIQHSHLIETIYWILSSRPYFVYQSWCKESFFLNVNVINKSGYRTMSWKVSYFCIKLGLNLRVAWSWVTFYLGIGATACCRCL